eukprot:6080287-Amphidinium_carterae.2
MANRYAMSGRLRPEQFLCQAKDVVTTTLALDSPESARSSLVSLRTQQRLQAKPGSTASPNVNTCEIVLAKRTMLSTPDHVRTTARSGQKSTMDSYGRLRLRLGTTHIKT